MRTAVGSFDSESANGTRFTANVVFSGPKNTSGVRSEVVGAVYMHRSQGKGEDQMFLKSEKCRGN